MTLPALGLVTEIFAAAVNSLTSLGFVKILAIWRVEKINAPRVIIEPPSVAPPAAAAPPPAAHGRATTVIVRLRQGRDEQVLAAVGDCPPARTGATCLPAGRGRPSMGQPTAPPALSGKAGPLWVTTVVACGQAGPRRRGRAD